MKKLTQLKIGAWDCSQKIEKQMLMWICEKGNDYSVLVGMKLCITTMEISVVILQKARNGSII